MKRIKVHHGERGRSVYSFEITAEEISILIRTRRLYVVCENFTAQAQVEDPNPKSVKIGGQSRG